MKHWGRQEFHDPADYDNLCLQLMNLDSQQWAGARLQILYQFTDVFTESDAVSSARSSLGAALRLYDLQRKKLPATNLVWLFNALKGGRDQESSETEIREVIVGLNDLIRRGDYSTMERILTSCDPTRMTTQTLLAFVRATVPVRAMIDGWGRFLTSAKSELESRGKDSSKLLRGLI